MKDQRTPPSDDALIGKLRKKKSSGQRVATVQTPGVGITRFQDVQGLSDHMLQKAKKRGPTNGISPLEDSSISGNEYRALRRKYLLLEEESTELGNELKETEEEIKALEGEKLGLLDELVVLEGLIDPSEIQPHGQRLA